jgi:predicted transcriptional regulator
MHQRIDHGAIVGAVAGGLHHDIAGETEVVAQRIEPGFRGVARRVLALRRIGKLGAGAKDMAVRVDRAGGQLESRR